jgi:peptide methionine sulfoxide reductase MsrB
MSSPKRKLFPPYVTEEDQEALQSLVGDALCLAYEEVSDDYAHECPRCKAATLFASGEPYCPDCGWDSVTDPEKN